MYIVDIEELVSKCVHIDGLINRCVRLINPLSQKIRRVCVSIFVLEPSYVNTSRFAS